MGLIALRSRVAALRLRGELAPPPVRMVASPVGSAAALMALPAAPALKVTGEIQGGWEFVVAAYLLSAAILIGYAVSIHLRYVQERARQGREEGGA
jgi:hypothetical protein